MNGGARQNPGYRQSYSSRRRWSPTAGTYIRRKVPFKEKLWGLAAALVVVGTTAAVSYGYHLFVDDKCQARAETDKECICTPAPNTKAPNIGGNH